MSYGRRTSYDGHILRQWRKGRDSEEREAQDEERRSAESTRTRSKTTMSPMGTRMSIGTPSVEVAVLRRTNGRGTEAMTTRTKIRLRRRIQRRRQSMKIYSRRRQRRRERGAGPPAKGSGFFHRVPQFRPTRQRWELPVRGRQQQRPIDGDTVT